MAVYWRVIIYGIGFDIEFGGAGSEWQQDLSLVVERGDIPHGD